MYRIAIAILLFNSIGCDALTGRTAARQARDEAKKAELKAFGAQMHAKSVASQAQARRKEIRILAWNIESDGSDPNVILEQLRASDMPEYDILALSEVPEEDAINFAYETWDRDNGKWGTTGGNDTLVLSWSNRFLLVRIGELKEYGGVELAPGNHCAPLYVHLSERATGQQFIVMNNHLARSNADLRTQQASALVEWARDQTLPVIAVGDYNMDYDFPTGEGNEAFAAILQDGVFKWIQPEKFVDTNWADGDGDGLDNYPDSMLDFAFVAGQAMDWNVTSRVVVRKGDFPDDEETSDHRPVLTVIGDRN